MNQIIRIVQQGVNILSHSSLRKVAYCAVDAGSLTESKPSWSHVLLKSVTEASSYHESLQGGFP